MAVLISLIPCLRSSRDSSRASISAQWEKVEESRGGIRESEEEVGDYEEGAEGKGVVEVTGGGYGGGGGGGWWGEWGGMN
jgi:hypothetical protein